ncbi:guanine deaminase-like [Hyposmocoma kahamanoa]|uniref:guanine deaminase-like n=1 Tax=Hyposmocoma kahamanoa TaxID=1477025 RepID=UPI000E6D7242|nr:guanine deaminase-like [Hyposmocoma kahamanoa]
MVENLIIFGTLVSSTGLNSLEVVPGYLIIEDGKIIRKGTSREFVKLEAQDAFRGFHIIKLQSDQFLMPGFVDCHTHGPQFPNLGLGLDRPLLEWLEKYTFPLESQFAATEYASNVYSQVVRRLLTNGTTTACYFGSLDLGGTMELVKSAVNLRQRALIGKVSMNMKNQSGYYNDTEREVDDSTKFVEKVLAFDNDLISPVISPRFALSCDNELMKKLAELAAKYNCHIQSHISENVEEVNEVLRQNPGCVNYAEVYDKCAILTNKCIMAHAVHLTDAEIDLLKIREVGIAHCPASNTRLRSGLCPVRKLINHGLRVGLGTDVSGGDSASILDAIRRTMDVSTHLELQHGLHRAINWKEAFYLGTLGGAKALSLDHKIGSLEVGKEFDALVINVFATGGPIDNHPNTLEATSNEYNEGLVQRFLYTGDDRNITQVYVKGHLVKNGWTVV